MAQKTARMQASRIYRIGNFFLRFEKKVVSIYMGEIYPPPKKKQRVGGFRGFGRAA
eukprot:COSAG02_NODE_1522_length_12158_cov_23.675263_3_plen_56_part_00